MYLKRLISQLVAVAQVMLIASQLSAQVRHGEPVASADDVSGWRVGAAGYTIADSDGWVLFRIRVTDQHGSKIVAENGAAGLAWSPNGQKIAFCADEDPNIAAISVLRGSRDSRVPGLFVNMLQGLIVSSSWFSSIEVANANGTEPKKILKARRGTGVCEPAWSPDGKQIAYTAYDDHSKRSNIYIMTADGNDSRFVTEGYRPQWSPDGRLLTFFRARKGPGTKSSVWVVNTDGTGLRSLTDDKSISWTPTWTEQGRILFASDRNGSSSIYAINADGTDLQKVASPDEYGIRGGFYVPRPSPDAKQALVDNYTFQGATSLVIVLDDSHRIGRLPVVCSRCLDFAARWDHK